jgi:hypothetical protein
MSRFAMRTIAVASAVGALVTSASGASATSSTAVGIRAGQSPAKAGPLGSLAFISDGVRSYARATHLTSGTLSTLSDLNDTHATEDDPSISIDPSGTSAVVGEDSSDLLPLTNLASGGKPGTPVSLAQFNGEGQTGYGVFTEGVALGPKFGLVAVAEQGAVQIRQVAGKWRVDGRVHSPGQSSLAEPHRPGFIAATAPEGDSNVTYDGAVVSKVPLRNGKYLGLIIDRDNKLLAVVSGVGTPTARVVWTLTDPTLEGTEASDEANGGVAFSPATATRAVVLTSTGFDVVNLTNPAEPKLQSVTTAGAPNEASSIAIAPDGDHVVVSSGGSLYGFRGLLHAAADKPLTPAGSYVPADPDSDEGYAIAFVSNGTLVLDRAGVDVATDEKGFYLSLVHGFETGQPHMGRSVPLGDEPKTTNDMAVMPALPPIAITPRHLPHAKVHHHFAIRLSVSGGIGHYRFTITAGHLPRGLALHGAKIVGKAKHRGVRHIRITATNQYGGAIIRVIALKVVR